MVNLMAPKPLRFVNKIEQSVVFPTLLWAPVTEIVLNDINKGYKKVKVRYKRMEEDVHRLETDLFRLFLNISQYD